MSASPANVGEAFFVEKKSRRFLAALRLRRTYITCFCAPQLGRDFFNVRILPPKVGETILTLKLFGATCGGLFFN
jgi:hypothetical protein